MSSVLGRKVWIDLGLLRIFCNLYIVLVAPPGRCRKSQALAFGEHFVRNVPLITVAADATTREALIREMANCQKTMISDDGLQVMNHCSLTCISSEFSVFLGVGNLPMIALLMRFYDCQEVFDYKTKWSGRDIVYGVWFNLLAATTPRWLTQMIPTDVTGVGLFSRVVFVVEQERKKRVTSPRTNPMLEEQLLKQLEQISQMQGSFTLKRDAYSYYDKWYTSLGEPDDTTLAEFYERKHISVLKVAMLLAAARQDMTITVDDIRLALRWVGETEQKTAGLLSGMGRSKLSYAVHEVRKAAEVGASYADLASKWRDMSLDDVNKAIETLLKAGEVYQDKDDEGRIIYRRRKR